MVASMLLLGRPVLEHGGPERARGRGLDPEACEGGRRRETALQLEGTPRWQAPVLAAWPGHLCPRSPGEKPAGRALGRRVEAISQMP